MSRLMLLALLWPGVLPAQNHFTPVTSTGIPYIIIITGVDVLGDTLVPGSEIAVFEDTLCVGAGEFDGHFNHQFSAWQRDLDQGLAGFTPGAPMSFRIWTEFQQQWQELGCTATFEEGDGTFGSGVFTAASLQAFSLGFGNEPARELPAAYALSAWPNPFNGQVQISYRFPGDGGGELVIYSVAGRRLFAEHVSRTGTLVWDGRGRQDRLLPSGVYFIALSSAKIRKQIRVSYIK